MCGKRSVTSHCLDTKKEGEEAQSHSGSSNHVKLQWSWYGKE